MSPLLGFSFRVFCVFHGLSSAPRIPKDGWDSRPYLAKFLVRSSLFNIRYPPRMAKLADSPARPSGFLDSRLGLFGFVVEEGWKVALGGPDRDTAFAIEEEAADVIG